MPDTLAERLTAWRTLAEGLKSRLEEVAFIKPDHAELAGFVQQIDGLMHEADVHEGRFREAVRQRVVTEERARELYGRMVARLKGTYGKRANVLHELGLRPEGVPGRRKEEEPTPPAPGTTPTEPPAPAPASAEEEPTAG